MFSWDDSCSYIRRHGFAFRASTSGVDVVGAALHPVVLARGLADVAVLQVLLVLGARDVREAAVD